MNLKRIKTEAEQKTERAVEAVKRSIDKRKMERKEEKDAFKDARSGRGDGLRLSGWGDGQDTYTQ